ncbi:MraY family glycosyltransferase [Tumidithrix helvetica PCC 7403]|uniref:glycosyltransferase family 4 protein n=1 Tax=Tumidithrix helvetica TaxID=3457545 RepID=UPI003C933D27
MLHQDAAPYLVSFVVSALVVWLSTPLIRSIGLTAGVTDKPNDRKMHTTPVVRLGGVSIFLGSLCALLLVWWIGWFGTIPTFKEYEIWGVTIGGAAFFLLGLADDLFDLPAIARLFMQLAIAAAAWKVGVRIDFVSIPFIGIIKFGVFSLPITMLWLAGMANAINWIDGLDGLAAGVTTIAAAVLLVTSLFMQQPGAALIAAALAGGCLGFLRYNFKPGSSAEIFMGDGGAYYLGFTLAGVSIIGLAKSVATVAVLLPYIILAVPILDGSIVILQRISNGQSPLSAGKHHLHHRLVKAGVSKRLTVLFIYALTLWVGSIAIAISGLPAGGTYAIVSTFLMLYACWQVWLRINAHLAKRQREHQKTMAKLPPSSSDLPRQEND